MIRDLSDVQFFVDESSLGLGKALAVARRDVIHTGHPLISSWCQMGTPDTDWIPAVAEKQWVAILRDRHVRTRPAEVAALRDAGLRVFWIAGRRDLPTWEWLCRVVKHWPKMEELVDTRGPGPWFYGLNDGGVREYTF